MSNNYDYQTLKELAFGTQPSDVSAQFAFQTAYYRNKLLRKIMTIFNFNNLPDAWDKNYLLRTLWNIGYFVVCDTPDGLLPQYATLNGFDSQDRPTEAIVSNPAFIDSPSITYDLKSAHAELVFLEKVTPPNTGSTAFGGIQWILDNYSARLAMCDSSIDVNLVNSKVAYAFVCENEAQAKTAKSIYDDITAGTPAVFTKAKANTISGSDGEPKLLLGNVKNNYVADLVQATKRQIMSEFLTEIGVNNTPIEKKERVQTAEVDSNNEEVEDSIMDWEWNLKDCIERVNKKFGLNISVERTYRRREVTQNDNSNTDTASNQPV